MEAKLSVVVPVYNVEKYLRQCIESILNQSMREIEVILVDDGSTDGSGAICDEFAVRDKRVNVVHQENGGVIAARRKGIEVSKCSYVTFVDGDDFVDAVSYILAKDSMENNIDVVIFGIKKYYDEQDQRIEYCKYPAGRYDRLKIEHKIFPSMIWDIEMNCHGLSPYLCNKIFKQELALLAHQELIGYKFESGEDSAVLYSVMNKAQLIEIKELSYYNYRQRRTFSVPDYIKKHEYFEGHYQRYAFLSKMFKNNEMLCKQLDYNYMYAVSMRRLVYNDRTQSSRYLFPFNKVRQGEQIVICGAGTVGQTYMEQLSRIDYCDMVLWVDKNNQAYGCNILPIEAIKKVSFDKIVIAIQNESTQDAVRKDLVSMGIEDTQIIK